MGMLVGHPESPEDPSKPILGALRASVKRTVEEMVHEWCLGEWNVGSGITRVPTRTLLLGAE